MFYDITDRKRIEEEQKRLEAQNRQLQKSESLGRMAGAIAHHFNNQLYAVMGNLEMAIDDLPRGADISETLAEAQKATRKAAEVSRLMLTYLGQTPSKHEPLDLSDAYRQSLTLLLAAAPKGTILNADFPSSGPIIRANVGQMQQIFTNLVTNAWESITDNMGTIALTIKTVSHEDIPTSNRFPIDWQPQEIDYACLEVSDTGSGIANKDIEKIFDPFFTTKFTGRGLGLPVVMGIVKAHGGGVTVESEQGRGSVFRFFLPVSTEELPIQDDLPAISEVLLTGKAEKLSKIEGGGTVLLIEDEDPVRNMTKKMLTRLGYTVLEAKDGAEAVVIFQKHQDKICFVLSDLTMPRMDGWETLGALRKISPDITVILSSGYDEAQVMAEEHTEIPNAFLGKPYQLKGLRETIKRVLTNMS
jgi:nitrogen-specific signal transduction histidine kinase